MNTIEITFKSFYQSLIRDREAQFRSTEKQLEKLHRVFTVTNYLKLITVEVQDKTDAIQLAGTLGLQSITYSEAGILNEIPIKAPKKSGRLSSVVHVEGVKRGMTINSYRKYTGKELQKTHLTKSQVIKAKLLTKTQLDKNLASGKLKVVTHGNKIFIDREEVFKLMK